jgi:hypothetical protein
MTSGRRLDDIPVVSSHELNIWPKFWSSFGKDEKGGRMDDTTGDGSSPTAGPARRDPRAAQRFCLAREALANLTFSCQVFLHLQQLPEDLIPSFLEYIDSTIEALTILKSTLALPPKASGE